LAALTQSRALVARPGLYRYILSRVRVLLHYPCSPIPANAVSASDGWVREAKFGYSRRSRTRLSKDKAVLGASLLNDSATEP